MTSRWLLAALIFVTLAGPAPAQSPPPEAMAAARSLVVTMKMVEQFKSLMPVVMQNLKPAIVQGRAEVARDIDAMMPKMLEALSGRYAELTDQLAEVYAKNFSADEIREIEAFYRQPIGQKMLSQMTTIAQQSMAVGQAFGQRAAEELRTRMIEELRKKGHNI